MRSLVDYRPALRSRTGVGEYVHELARALVRTAGADDQLSLFSSSWSDRLAADAVPGATAIDCRWPVRALNYAWHHWQWPPVELVAGALGARPDARYDVVQSLHPLLMPARHAAQVVTVHDLDFLDHPERTSAEIRRDYPQLAAAHARRADHVITVSKFTAADIERRLGVSPDRISICSPGAPAWSPRFSAPEHGYILFLGTLEPRKNVGVLLDAYARLRSRDPQAPTLVLAGRPAPGSERWVARCAEAPLAGHVDLRGYVAPEDRQALMAGAAVLVLPSFLEGFGIPALEAMTLGVPVIVSDRGALPEVVGDAGLQFPAEDANALAARLTHVLGDRGVREHLQAAGPVRARAFSWTQTAEHTRDAWRRAIAARGRRG